MTDKEHMYTIGALAEETGCKVQTIRYYEQIGLMPEPPRTEGGQRRYTRKHSDRLCFIRHSRELGFSLDAIRELLSLTDLPDNSCEAADAIARSQLADVENRIARLQSLKQELQRMVTQCKGGTIDQCRVIEVLSDYTHAHCINTDHLNTVE